MTSAGDVPEDTPAPEQPEPGSSPSVYRLAGGWIAEGFKDWSDADRRVLMITVVGGLTVNILTVVVLALAVLMLNAFHNATDERIIGSVAIAGVFVTLGGVIWMRFTKTRRAKRIALVGLVGQQPFGP